METNRGLFLPVLSCLCVVSMVVACIVSGHYTQSMRISSDEPGDSSLSPSNELQTNVRSSQEFRAVFSGQPPAFYVSRLRNQSLIRKLQKPRRYQELENGLARARASILKALSNLNGSSAIDGGGDDEVPTSDVYRNPGAFYQ